MPKGLIYTCTHIFLKQTLGSDVMSTYNTFEQGKISRTIRQLGGVLLGRPTAVPRVTTTM